MVRFGDRHPAVTALYYAALAGTGMFIQHPAVQLTSLCGALLFFFISRSGRPSVPVSLGVLALAMTLVNPLISHRGSTVLLYVNDNPVTLEALIWGANSGVMAASVLLWTYCFSRIMTVEKTLCLTGRISPRIAAVGASAVRFIPLFGRYYEDISSIKRSGRARDSDASPAGRLKESAESFSATVGLALETSVDAADSMDARGWGSPSRRRFDRFVFGWRDAAVMAAVAVCAGICAASAACGALEIAFYPVFSEGGGGGPVTYISLAAFAALSLYPAACECAWLAMWRARERRGHADLGEVFRRWNA